MFDLDAYLERIGLTGRPGLAEVHRAHGTAIPFENLDPHRGLPVSLAPTDLERKLVAERRGGYCFEQNLLLKAALEALGAEVDLMLARVALGAEPGRREAAQPPRAAASREGSASWHADVGFGLGTLLEPLPFGPGAEHEQGGLALPRRRRTALNSCCRPPRARGGWTCTGSSPQPVPPSTSRRATGGPRRIRARRS